MNKDTEFAKQILLKGNYTCVLVNGEKVLISKERGVKPLLAFLKYRLEDGFSASDKVVGKSAAMIYVTLGVKEVYATVMSKLAVSTFQEYGIKFYYENLADRITNREKTGFCPMEELVANVNDPKEALALLENKVKETDEKQTVAYEK